MSPSSSRSDAEPFAYLVARGVVAEATSATAWLQAMVDAEAALVLAQADVGDVPAVAAMAIAAACRADRFDVAEVFAEAELGGNPVIALLPRLRALVETPELVHRGATSQDIVDTAMMLVVQRCSDLTTGRLRDLQDATTALAHRHRDTPISGRTLLQRAVPTTFGAIATQWSAGLDAARAALSRSASELPAQLGGPVGDRRSFGESGDAIAGRYAAHLGLVGPAVAWHAQRSPVAAVAGAWGLAAAAVATIALDIVVLAQSDVGELSEVAVGSGGSSSMAHKRNPIAAVSARAAAMQVPATVATLLHAAGNHELQRAAGAWHAEWPAVNALLRATGSAVEWLAVSVERLVIDEDRMAANLRRHDVEMS